MAKSKKLDQKSDPKKQGVVSVPKFSSRCMKVFGDARHDKRVEPPEKNDWDNALCSVCMEFPHDTVLLLCSSYEKGCRPYMCATSHRYSNCLEQYRNACTNVTLKQSKISELLLCPLCRGEVKGWTVVEPARRYLNAKKRTCLQDNCSFVGNFRELRKHVKSEHPLARPRDVDPLRAEKWKKLEDESGLSDAFSTVRSTMPGAIVIGDYAVEGNFRGVSGGRFEGDYGSLDYERFDGLQARSAVASSRIGDNRLRVGLLVARRTGRLRGDLARGVARPDGNP